MLIALEPQDDTKTSDACRATAVYALLSAKALGQHAQHTARPSKYRSVSLRNLVALSEWHSNSAALLGDTSHEAYGVQNKTFGPCC